ncbi:probable inorganic phosphate transporter 1-4 isoform X2 [Arachis stenosperma]|uniref:probable inorganic phosphate transporter 1-4 isoform X2 n=1 Tax=Arachis stenosperma TaxID=217475 RepID=UPI0025ACC8E9|nr:probable inorganic phosphate transporter 1-4 isoform X2 [Arachis stenosperma]
MAEPLIWLRELDSARIQRYHYYTIVVAGLGLLTFGYSFFCGFLVIILLRCMKAPSIPSPGDFYPVVHPSVDVSALGGTLAGQLIFGLCCDKFGRKIVYEFILTLMVVCCCCSGLSFGTKVEAVLVTLYFFRFCLGFLGGATYSLAATFISENANKRKRGMFIAAGFAMQGLGTLFAGIAVIIISSTTIHKYHDFYWRILLMSVAVLPFGAYLLLKTMPETPRFTNFVSNNPSQAASDAYGALNLQLPSGQENAQHLNVQRVDPSCQRD